MTGSRTGLLLLVACLSLIVALSSYRFLALDIDLAFTHMAHQLQNAKMAFIAHIIASPLALFCGAFQFFPGLRTRRPGLHRWTGRFYMLAVVVGSASGIIIAFEVPGVIGASGFLLLSCAWAFTSLNGWRLVRAGNYTDHRRWMFRSFALTFAGVTLRLQLFGFFLAGSGYDIVYPFLAWSCWIPNLIFAEWWLRQHPVPQPAHS